MHSAPNMADPADRTPYGVDYVPDGYPPSPLNLSAIRGLLYRQRWILIAIVPLALLAGLVFTLLQRPIYQANTTVQIDSTRSGYIVEGQDLESDIGNGRSVDRYLETEGAIIKSRRLAYRVVDSLKLANRADFLGEMATNPPPDGMTAKQWADRKREAAVSAVVGRIAVAIPGDSSIITISYRSEDRAMAALIANTVAENYVTEDLRRNIEMNAYAQDYLRGQIDAIRQKLQQAEIASNNYARANGLVGSALAQTSSDAASGPAPTITVVNLAAVNASYTEARAKRIAAEQRWNAVARISAAELPEVQTNVAIQDMIKSRSAAMSQLSELRERYGEGFPQIQELKAQIAALDSQIARSSSEIKDSIRNNYTIALRQEQGLASELGKVSDETLSEQDRRVQYNLLDREASALRTQLASLLDRYNQITSAANLNTSRSSLLDRAQVPGQPVSPRLSVNLLVSLVLGVALAVGLAILREIFDDHLRSPDDVESKLGLQLLGFTPSVSDEKVDDELLNPFSPLMEAYSSIRTAVDFALGGDHRVIQVTSSQPAEGKSMTSIQLARRYARLGRRTLLIDADLRKPSVAAQLGIARPKHGFAEVLLGDAKLEDALLPLNEANLDVLSVSEIAANPVDLLSSQVLGDFIDRYRGQYSVIIFDSPPIMGLADAPLLSRLVDGTIFIAEANRAHFGQAKTALRRLRVAGANVIGVVMTKYRAADAGYSYNYNYNYYSYGSKSRD